MPHRPFFLLTFALASTPFAAGAQILRDPGVVASSAPDASAPVSVEAARRYTEDFPLSKAGLLEWHFLAFDAPLPLEYLFDPTVDVAQPWNRTAAA